MISQNESNTIETKPRVQSLYCKVGLMENIKYNDKIDLTVSAKYYYAFTDLLDGWVIQEKTLMEQKMISLFIFRYFLYVRKQKTVAVEWYSPLDKMYHFKKKSHKQIDGLTKDSDQMG